MRIGRRRQYNAVSAPTRLIRGNRSTKTKLGVLAGTLLVITFTGGATVTLAAGAATMAPKTVTTLAPKTVLFSGHYHGVASLLINNGVVTISSVAGTGTGTLLGSSTVVGKGSSSSTAQCDPFTGSGSLTGAKGKINLTVTSSKSAGCSSGQSGPVTVTFHGVAVAKGGTGTATGAAGSLKFNGTLKLANTSGSQNGPYTVTLTGNLTVRG